MNIANAALITTAGLPEKLLAAQEAIHFPEVQEMLRKLSAHNLGIFMPHMHGEQGKFEVLPDDFVQVEGGLEVSFKPSDDLLNGAESYVPVGWFWRADAQSPKDMCKMGCVKRPPDTMHYGT